MIGESADEAMRCSQNGMRWVISMVPRDNDGSRDALQDLQ